MGNVLPGIKSLDRKTVFSDLIAGLTVAVMLVPQGMAYAMLAGLPPIYGLYAGLVPLLIYPFFGTSKYLSVGPVALVSIIVVSGLSEFAEPMSQEFVSLAILTSIVAGVIQLILSVLRMGWLVNFLSHPVMAGFTSAAAFIIALSQLKYIFGVNVPRSSTIIGTLSGLFSKLGETNYFAVLIGLGALALIMILKRLSRAIPGALIVVILGIIVTTVLSLDENGLDIVAEVPSGLPGFFLPEFSVENIRKILPLALIICLISFIESLAIAKTLAARKNDFDIDANQELLGLGLAKIVGGFFQGYPNTGSFTRSAINEQSGAKTGLSSIFAALFIALVLLAFTGLFYYLPKAILASIVISAVFGLIDYKEAKHLFLTDRRDFMVFMATFLLTLILGVQQGVFAGIILSVILILYRASRPHYAMLGKLPNSAHFRNLERNPDAVCPPNTLIFRYDGDLFFGNADHFYNTVMELLRTRKHIKRFILNATAFHDPDSTGLHKLEQIITYCNKENIEFIMTDAKGPFKDLMRKSHLYESIGHDSIFLSVEEACGCLDDVVSEEIVSNNYES